MLTYIPSLKMALNTEDIQSFEIDSYNSKNVAIAFKYKQDNKIVKYYRYIDLTEKYIEVKNLIISELNSIFNTGELNGLPC